MQAQASTHGEGMLIFDLRRAKADLQFQESASLRRQPVPYVGKDPKRQP
jgi:hypothetical protein